jgi:hypothetical protein
MTTHHHTVLAVATFAALAVLAPIVTESAHAQGVDRASHGEAMGTGSRLAPILANRVDQCVAITLGETVVTRNLVLIGADLQVRESIGNCGCMSAKMSYRVTARIGTRTRELTFGELNTLQLVGKSEQIYVVLSTDHRELASADKLTVTIGCSPPR